MNGQFTARINELEKEIKVLKSLVKKGSKKPKNKSLLAGIWTGLKVTDKELEETKKAPFNFDLEKYLK